MGFKDFNRNECIRALYKLGFSLSKSSRGNHDKFITSQKNCNPPFIMVPRHNNIHCQGKIIRDIKMMGGDELVKQFIDLL